MKLRPLLITTAVITATIGGLALAGANAAPTAPVTPPAAVVTPGFNPYALPPAQATAPVQDYYTPPSSLSPLVQRQTPSYFPSFSAPLQEPSTTYTGPSWYETNQHQLAAAQAYNDEQRLRAVEQAQQQEQGRQDTCRWATDTTALLNRC